MRFVAGVQNAWIKFIITLIPGQLSESLATTTRWTLDTEQLFQLSLLIFSHLYGAQIFPASCLSKILVIRQVSDGAYLTEVFRQDFLALLARSFEV